MVAFAGTHFLVVWTDNRFATANDIYAARVDTAGTVLDPSGIPISIVAADKNSPAVAFDGTNALVIWADKRSGTSFDIYGARVSAAGTVLDPNGIPVSTAAEDQSAPTLVFDGTHYLVAWTDHRSGASFDVYGARVSTAGAVLDPSGPPISTARRQPDLRGGRVRRHQLPRRLARRPHRPQPDVYGARVSAAGTVLDPGVHPDLHRPTTSVGPAVAFGGTNYLVVWDDRRPAPTTTSTAPGSARRARSSTRTASSSSAPPATRSSTPRSPFDGTNYLVVWDDSSPTTVSNDIYGASPHQRRHRRRQRHPRSPPRPTVRSPPSVASDGIDYLVVWEDRRSGTDHDIYGTRVTKTGTVLDPVGTPISTAAGEQVTSAVGFDGTDFLVVWEDHRSGTNADIYGSRVAGAGNALDPSGIPISTAANDQLGPKVASDGTNALVVWSDNRSGTSRDIYGTRVSNTGTVLSPSGTPISTAPNDQSQPALAFNGTYLVIWNDRRAGTRTDIYGARVDTTGAVQDAVRLRGRDQHRHQRATRRDQRRRRQLARCLRTQRRQRQRHLHPSRGTEVARPARGPISSR